MDDIKEYDVSGIIGDVLLIVVGGELMTSDNPSLSGHGYQLLPLATSHLMGDSWEFNVSGLFSPV